MNLRQASSLQAATGRTPACRSNSGTSEASLSAATGRHTCVSRSNPGASAASLSAATGRIPACQTQIRSVRGIPFSGDRSDTCVPSQSRQRQRHPFQRRQVGHLRGAANQARQRHPFQRRQVGYLRVAAISIRQRHPFQRRQVGYLGVWQQSRFVSGIPFSGDRSENLLLPSPIARTT